MYKLYLAIFSYICDCLIRLNIIFEGENMLRRILTSTEDHLIIPLPKEYLNKKIEVLVLPYFEENEDITYWSEAELESLSRNSYHYVAEDNEDYSKW